MHSTWQHHFTSHSSYQHRLPLYENWLQVYGLPTLIVFKDGQELAGSKREGAITKPLLEQYLTKNGISK